MTVVTPDQDFLNLWQLVVSGNGLTAMGQICSILSLIILAADIRRVHTEIRTKKPTGVIATEKEINRIISEKYKDIAKIEDNLRWSHNSSVIQGNLNAEIRDILRLHQLQTQLTESYFILNTVDSIVSSGRSWSAVYIATLIAVAGAGLQAAAIFIA
jgi:hypothetical protein